LPPPPLSQGRRSKELQTCGHELYKTVQVWGGGSLTPAVHMYTYPIARLCG
jgi:hypothetical protein